MEGGRNHLDFSPVWSQWKTGIPFSPCSTHYACFFCPQTQRFSLPFSCVGKPSYLQTITFSCFWAFSKQLPLPNSCHYHIKNQLKASKYAFHLACRMRRLLRVRRDTSHTRHTYAPLCRAWDERSPSCLPRPYFSTPTCCGATPPPLTPTTLPL